LRADAAPDQFAEGVFDSEIDSLWEEWRQGRKMLRHAMAPNPMGLAKWNGGEASFPISGDGWTRTQISIDAKVATAIRITPYQSPCQVWIRRAAWIVDGVPKKATLRATQNGMLEQVYGLTLLTVFGPDTLVVETPTDNATLELEMFVQADRDVLTNLIP